MTRRVLLTGAAGFVGAHVLKSWLEETDWQFVCPVTFAHKGIPERIEWATENDWVDEVGSGRHGGWSGHWNRVHVIRHDCATPVNTQTADRFGDVDTIVNLASDTHPPRSVTHPVEFSLNNYAIGLYLLQYARTIPGLKAFVQISTDAVYGPAPEGQHHEWDAHNPNNPYSASKAAQEDLACAWWRSYSVPVIVAATMNPTGETQDPEKFLPMAIGRLLRGEALTIHADQDRQPGARTYIYGRDVADGLRFILDELPPAAFKPGTDRPDRWNIVGREEVDNLTAVRTLARALGVGPSDWTYNLSVVDRPEHGHRYAMSGEKLAAAGWEPKTDIYEALARMARWYQTWPAWLD